MSGYYNQPDPDGFESGQDNNGGGLRKMLEEALAMNKTLVEKLNGNDRLKTVTELLKGKGIDPAVSALVPTDADPNEWLDKNGHFFGVKSAENVETQPGTEPEITEPAVEDAAVVAERQARAAMQAAAESGSEAVPHGDLIEQMNKAGTEAELIALMKSNGMA